MAGASGRPGTTVEPLLRIENLGPQHAYFNRLAASADSGLAVNSLQNYHAAGTGYGACTVTSATAGACPAGSSWPPAPTVTPTGLWGRPAATS